MDTNTEITNMIDQIDNMSKRARYIGAVCDDLTTQLLHLRDKVKAIEDENLAMTIRKDVQDGSKS